MSQADHPITSRQMERQERILRAASQLIARYGFDKTTMDDIAREAGVSKGAIYLHWSNKEELFDHLLLVEMQKTLDDFWSRVDGDPQGGTIGKMYEYAVLAMQDNPFVRALYTQESRILGDYVRRRGAERYAPRFLFSQEMIRQMQAAGLVRADLAVDVIAYLMSVIAYGFIGIESIIPADKTPALDAVAAGLADTAQRAFGAEGGDPEAGKRALAGMIALIRRQYQQELTTHGNHPKDH